MSTTDAIRGRWAEMKAGEFGAGVAAAGLSDRQRQLYRLIYETARDRGYQPSFADMCGELGIGSKNGVVCHLTALDRKGWLVYRTGQSGARCLTLLRTPSGAPFRGFAEKEGG